MTVTEHYIDRVEMTAELILSQQSGVWTERLTAQMRRLARGIAHHDFFIRYCDREGLIQSGLLHLLEIWQNFDITRPSANPFGYFSLCLFREYSRITRNEYEYTNFKHEAAVIARHFADSYLSAEED
jgi:hypothetical protein